MAKSKRGKSRKSKTSKKSVMGGKKHSSRKMKGGSKKRKGGMSFPKY
jgi:hypothetical protein